MIVTLTGTLQEASPTHAVLDVCGVGYELGISSTTAAALPALGEPGVSLYTRMVVREDAMLLYGFATREERTLFDRLCQISGVGPKLALSVLSTFNARELASVCLAGDTARMSNVSGVGKKLAGRLVLELESAFASDIELRSIAGVSPVTEPGESIHASALEEATAALLSMGFTPQEASLALEDADENLDTEAALAFALKRLGGGA